MWRRSNGIGSGAVRWGARGASERATASMVNAMTRTWNLVTKLGQSRKVHQDKINVNMQCYTPPMT